MHKLLDYICDELDALEKKAESGKLSMAEIQYGDTLAHFKKNLLKSDEMMNEGYSMDGYPNRMYPYSMDDSSYARGRTGNVRRDSMGRYSSRDNRGYSRTGYSMDDDFMSELHELKRNAPTEVKQEVQQFIERIQNKM